MTEAHRAAGWAAGAVTDRLAYLPEYGEQEPAYTIADAWQPPHDLSLSAEACDRLRASVDTARLLRSGNGTYFLPTLDDGLRGAVVDRFAAANEAWWRLAIDEWWIGVKRYQPGEQHPLHQDLHAGAARRKFAGVVQRSEPDDYQGGELVMRFAHHAIPMPRARGTLVAFPGWTVHEVLPITGCERWSLCVNGWGAPLR